MRGVAFAARLRRFRTAFRPSHLTAMPDEATTAAPPDAEPNAEHYEPLRRGDLRRGATLKTPVLDERGVLLLNAGQVISEAFHAKLCDRGLDCVRVHRDELPALLAGRPQGDAASAKPARAGVVAEANNKLSDGLDAVCESGRGLDLPAQGDAFQTEQQNRGHAPHDPAARDAAAGRLAAAVNGVTDIQKELADAGKLDLTELNGFADAALADLADDGDLFAALGINPHGAGYPHRHAMHAAMLAAAVGAKLGLDRPTLRELVVGVLVHDAGMLRVDAASYEHAGSLSRDAFLEITKHPVRTFERLTDVRAVPARAAFIAYQMHERCDGTGYPRRRTAAQLHPLAKIAAVADVYTALAAPRPYRPGLAPHHAMTHVLREAAAGKLDGAAARALLAAVSLFPLGSRVKLSDGRRGRVLRATDDVRRPLLELDAPGGEGGGEILDLSAHPALNVVGVAGDAAPVEGGPLAAAA